MRILIDTQCWLWWHGSPDRLSSSALRLIGDGGNQVFLSAASSWEISIKHVLGKLELPLPPARYIPLRLRSARMEGLDVTHAHALRVSEIPAIHRDPFDRLLIAQAQIEKLALLTADEVFGKYDVELLPGS